MVELLTPLAVIFIVSAAFLVVANRFSIPAIPVFILAGLAVGPFIPQGATVELARWGVAFLVFAFGVDVEPHRFRSVARASEHVSLVQLVLIGGLAYGCGLLFGLDPLNALYVGAAAALSSSLVGRELAIAEIRQNLVHGRLVSSIHFVQDLFAVVLILALSAATFTLDGIAAQLGFGVIVLLGAAFVRVYLFELLMRLSGDSGELIVLTGIGILVGFISAAELLGISIVIGAFAAGLAIPREFSGTLALQSGIESFEDFFTAIFFVTVGSLVTVPSVTATLLATVLFGLIVVVKPLVTTALLLREGYEPRTAALTSFGLDQVSEFTLILVIEALVLGRISSVVFEAVILVAAASMITSTLTRQYEEDLAQWLLRRLPFRSLQRQSENQSNVDATLHDHVIVVGYGRLGRLIARICAEEDQSILVIEHDPERMERVEDTHDQYVFGDAMSRRTWDRARVEEAKLILSTVPQSQLSERILELDTEADRILRANSVGEATTLLEAGADYVNVPDHLASERLVETLREALSGESIPDSSIADAELRLPPVSERTATDN